jgi:hypothetical protein
MEEMKRIVGLAQEYTFIKLQYGGKSVTRKMALMK